MPFLVNPYFSCFQQPTPQPVDIVIDGNPEGSVDSGNTATFLIEDTSANPITPTAVNRVGDQFTITVPASTPSNLIYNRGSYRGQTTSYALYDLAWQASAGTYNYGNPIGQKQSLDWSHATSFYMLELNNAFNNKYRFTDSNGLQAPDNLANFAIIDWAVDRPTAIPYYVIDHLTGMGWIAIKVAFAQEWGQGATECLGFADAYTHGGFSDYRIPSSAEIEDVINTGDFGSFFSSNNIFYRSNDLSATSGNETSIWLNGTNPANTAQALILNDNGDITRAGKTSTTLRGTYLIRTHYT